jgi:hypothetical protein
MRDPSIQFLSRQFLVILTTRVISHRLTFLEPIHQPTLALHPHTLTQPSYSNNPRLTPALRSIAPSIAKLHPTRLDLTRLDLTRLARSLHAPATVILASQTALRRAPTTFCRSQTPSDRHHRAIACFFWMCAFVSWRRGGSAWRLLGKGYGDVGEGKEEQNGISNRAASVLMCAMYAGEM